MYEIWHATKQCCSLWGTIFGGCHILDVDALFFSQIHVNAENLITACMMIQIVFDRISKEELFQIPPTISVHI